MIKKFGVFLWPTIDCQSSSIILWSISVDRPFRQCCHTWPRCRSTSLRTMSGSVVCRWRSRCLEVLPRTSTWRRWPPSRSRLYRRPQHLYITRAYLEGGQGGHAPPPMVRQKFTIFMFLPIFLFSDIKIVGTYLQKSFSFWGTSSPRPPTGALPLDPTGALPSPRPPDFMPPPYVNPEYATGTSSHTHSQSWTWVGTGGSRGDNPAMPPPIPAMPPIP